jgi:type IV pilus assembly protein PilC
MILKSGIPLYDGLEAIYETYKETANAPKFEQLVKGIEESNSLYESVKAMNLFPPYMVNMVRIGEKTGKLDDVMESLSVYFSRDAKIRSSVRSAVTYPLALVGIMAVVIMVLVIKVLPIFSQIYSNLGTDLYASPLMNLGTVLGKTVLVIVGILLLIVILIAILLKTKYKNNVLKAIYRIIPPARQVEKKVFAGRFASVVAMMYSSGYNLEETMELIPTIISDENFSQGVDKIREALRENKNFAEAIAQAQIFDGLHNQMIHVGSAAGQLVMQDLADLYDDEIEESISALISLIEPTSVAVLSIVIGGILLSVMLPLISIISSMG